VRGIDFNAAAAPAPATPPAAEDNKKTIIPPTVEEKKHPFLLARGMALQRLYQCSLPQKKPWMII
jgi:hypothetical protein